MDKILKVKESKSIMTVKLKNGRKIKVPAITTDTYWESGIKDCVVKLLEPLSGSAKSGI